MDFLDPTTPHVSVTWRAPKGSLPGGSDYELTNLTTIDGQDIRYAVEQMVAELRRLHDSRTFRPGQQDVGR